MRLRQTKPLVDSREEAEACLGEIATLTIELRRLQTELDGKITAAREEYEESLARVGEQIKSRQDHLMSWASGNPDLFATKKSLEMTHGVVGFRTGMPKLKTLAKRTWAIVLDTFKAAGKHGWVRTTEEVNKEQVIADFQSKAVTAEELKPLGVAVVQDEAFYVEVKLTEMSNREAIKGS
jgi:phage host-nuclease inhibitor protein Gam